MSDVFPPTRAAGLARLAAFAPRAGRLYAGGRNTDAGPEARPTTALLSPYIRRRLVLEREAVAAAHAGQGDSARKFVEEVFWRTYWKGYLEQHPSLWTRYRAEVAHGWDRLAAEAGLRQRFDGATAGRTGIAAFDAWAGELVARNWLHNHARMWFASIWVFTLRLPWALGADFFARHLLDGDPASNTLSWRWVAGLHTQGRPYVARAENIARYTAGRFHPAGALDEDPEPLAEDVAAPLAAVPAGDAMPAGEIALLLHDDDLCAETLDLGEARVGAVVGFSAASAMARHGVAPAVAGFAEAALADGLARAGAAFGVPPLTLAGTDIAGWVRASAAPVVAPYAPLGPAAEAMAKLPIVRVLRPWDRLAWPHARRGFFQLREHIDEVLAVGGLG